MERELDEQLEPNFQRSYAIPGCSVSIHSEEPGITVEDFLAIAFNLASSNPDTIVHFNLTIYPPEGGA